MAHENPFVDSTAETMGIKTSNGYKVLTESFQPTGAGVGCVTSHGFD